MPQISKEEYNRLMDLKEQYGEVETPPSANGVPFNNFNHFADGPINRIKEFTDKPDVLVSRKTLLVTVGSVAVLLLISWPMMIVSFILGAATVVKVGCPNEEKKK